ncbi:MAG: thioredoxin domain-containing protein [Patescibacteria group bacterium]|nr:thioredoxin domain-containing protein [Patescibacteria group bacterium]
MSETKKIELTQPMAIVVAGVIIAGAIVFVNYYRPAAAAGAGSVVAAPSTSVNVHAPSSADHIIGSPSAPVVLIEYSDFQCPYCAMIYPELKSIVQNSNGKIAWVMRNFPLYQIHPNAEPAANAAECIADELGNDAYWKFADTIFADQSKMSDQYYATLAKQLGANPATFSACYSGKKFQSKIDADEAEAEQNGGTGTPYTVVYGKGKQLPVSGALPQVQIESVINSL